ncbi:MAG: [protein-PII] uridylyltransferase [Acidimicrobiales bacterium]|nr:MAG: [protein-PII] uridylyltransferase [Acidimicrobiales bacterium]
MTESTSLRRVRDQLLARTDLQGSAWCEAYSAAADAWLAELLDRATGGKVDGVGLMAVGGYGRGQLWPGSDLDLVLVHRGRRDVASVAQAVWYPVWDERVRLDHSVRTPREVMAVADTDLRAALGLLDARVVAGDTELVADLPAKAAALWRARAGRWLPALAASVEERRASHGDLAFLLEPDLKEAHGGLRDAHALRAAAQAAPVLSDLAYLRGPLETLGRVRVELHRRTGKALDRLLLQEQDQVAVALGLEDADALMAEVAAAGRCLAWASDDAWRRVASWQEGPRGRRAGGDRPLEAGLVTRDKEVTLATDADPASDASLALRAAAVGAELGLPLSRQCLSRLAAEASPPGDPWSPETRRALVRVLGTGQAGMAGLETLDQQGILVRLVPEWQQVRNRPQRNAYHRFTVDRHLLEAAANAAVLTDNVSRPDLLLVGALLHDIGKGFPGDHTDTGVVVMGEVATRMGFAPLDVQILVTMVRHHLLLPDAATRRDLDDPATVEAVAAAVGDETTLDLLAALTEADSLATGPAAWGSWKAGLVSDLVARTRRHLAGHQPDPATALPDENHLRLMASGQLHLSASQSSVTVTAPDRPGLLACVAGVLALHRIDVHSAQVGSDGTGMAVEVFEVEAAEDATDWARVERDLAGVLDGLLSLGPRLAERARAYAGARRPRAARTTVAQVTVDNGASTTASVVEVRAPDGVGVLYRIAQALADCQLDVSSAKVATLGHEVVDSFYVRDQTGAKLIDSVGARGVEAAILTGLAGEPVLA